MARTAAVWVSLAAGSMLWASGVAAADPHPPGTAFAIGMCVDGTQPVLERPLRFAYNCDGTGVMTDMNWTSWGRAGANGTGTDVAIECQPNCAQGTRLANPIVVRAWNPVSPTSDDCPRGVQYYSDVTIAYPKSAPPWIDPGTTWDVGTDFVTVDGMPAVHFSGLAPNCLAR